MRNIVYIFCVLIGMYQGYAQFEIKIKTSGKLKEEKVYVYTYEGSKEVLFTSANRSGSKWQIQIPERYIGAMKLYFPTVNRSIQIISENKPVQLLIHNEKEIFSKVEFKDESNLQFTELRKHSFRKKQVLPYLKQLLGQYESSEAFHKAIKQEIENLGKETTVFTKEKNPYLAYYQQAIPYATEPTFTLEQISQFLSTQDGMLENSALIRPIVSNFMNKVSKVNPAKDIDAMLEKADIDSNRGQVILAELLNIFHLYQLEDLKQRYLEKASSMTCSNQMLDQTVRGLKKIEIGAKFPAYHFTPNVTNTTEKSIDNIKANKKLVFFWSSTCGHCMAELPLMIENYQKLKAKNIELIGIALEDNLTKYKEVTKDLPWINDSEIKGWNADAVKEFVISGTPTFFLLDENNKIIENPIKFLDFLNQID